MICYWSEHCMLRPSLWFVTGENTVCYHQVYDLLLVRTLYYDQVYDLILVRTLYVMIKFMNHYWSEHFMLRPNLWFVIGQNTVWYDQVYDLLLVRTLWYDQVYDLLPVKTLYATTKFMICYWSEHGMLRPSLWFVTSQNTMLRPSLWFVTGQNTVCYDQVYDLLPVETLYATTKFMICYWSEHCMLLPSLWFVTGQNAVCYD
jgi:hypothetical protein